MPSLRVHDVTTGTSGICANGERRERQPTRLAGGRDKWSMYQNLDIIIAGIEHGRLIEEYFIRSIWIPSDYVPVYQWDPSSGLSTVTYGVPELNLATGSMQNRAQPRFSAPGLKLSTF